MFRLRQKHSRNLAHEWIPVSAEKLIAAQSPRAAITGAAIAIMICTIVWVYTAVISDRFFPWGSIVQGVIIGIAVQKSGRGLDGRFPLIAGVAAWIGAFSGNLFIALVFTGMETSDIGGDWLEILRSFYVNTVSIIDVIYAFCAVAVAAFFAKRRLNRYEVFALRKHAARQNG